MARDVELTLRKMSYPIVNGIPTADLERETVVLGYMTSAKRAEFYGAMQAGYMVDTVFSIFSFDYDNEQEIRYDGSLYDVKRSYLTKNDQIELVCARRDAK